MSERPRNTVTFIVRASRDHGGLLRGIVEHVKSGAKESFRGSDTLGEVIDKMVGPETPKRRSHVGAPVRSDRIP
jgi:hypothetical protein